MTDQPTRRSALGAMLAAPLAFSAAESQAAPRTPVVTLLGDSITAGYGLPAPEALPVQLQRELRALGINAAVRGAGVSGSTTAGGLRRVEQVRSDTDVCVVALGGNDLLSFLPPTETRSNLEQIVRRLKARGVRVVLAGLQAPAELGAYARSFNAVFPSVAKAQSVPLYPSLLAGVLLDSRYNQPDLVHPNAAGVRIIAQRLAPVVAQALRAQQRV
ncbi:MAG: arylesterase [Proteobacteria bacterium]|nr:arylesterase [Pseudomonadota bacterium]